MKKISIVILLISILLLTGCSKEKYFLCKIDLYNKVQEYELNAEYKVYYDDSYVTRIEKKEIYKTNKKDTLNYFNEYKNLEYTNINNLYGGVTHNIKKEIDKIILDASIDFSLTNINKMVKDKYIDGDYVIDDKLTISGIKEIYKEKGAICK